MKRLLTILLTFGPVLASCSDDTVVAEPNSSDEVVEFIAGTVELTGRLANTPEGGLQVVATAPELATPLVQKCVLLGLEKTATGTLLVPFSLGSHSGMMASRAIPLAQMPAELSLKVSYSSNSFVEGIEPEHDIVVPVRVGDTAIKLRLEPQEAPRSRPTSRSTSRPVVAED